MVLKQVEEMNAVTREIAGLYKTFAPAKVEVTSSVRHHVMMADGTYILERTNDGVFLSFRPAGEDKIEMIAGLELDVASVLGRLLCEVTQPKPTYR